ncbi:hypothetical protein BS78_09G181900 [Paspalum vaginatum]|nr:hypothetical protein BS78_09G181900 [Paspalum vaginatum]
MDDAATPVKNNPSKLLLWSSWRQTEGLMLWRTGSLEMVFLKLAFMETGHKDDYVHRFGRTGRAGKSGLATAFFNESNISLARPLSELMQEARSGYRYRFSMAFLLGHRFPSRCCFLLVVLIFSAVADGATTTSTRWRRRSLTEEAPPSPGGYRSYIVLLQDPGRAMDDEAAHRAWHESFLPTKLTRLGEPRLTTSAVLIIINIMVGLSLAFNKFHCQSHQSSSKYACISQHCILTGLYLG